jgi:hypothetical protein
MFEDLGDNLDARKIIEERAIMQMKHGRKKFATTGMPHFEFAYDTEYQYIVNYGNTFYHIIKTVLHEAINNYPEKFGTGDARDVIDALFETRPVGVVPDFEEFLRTEKFCYILRRKDKEYDDRFLRIDLYRLFQANFKTGLREFTGGLFHALRHFSYHGIPWSTMPGSKDIVERIDNFIFFIAKAFFENTEIPEEEGKYEVIAENEAKSFKILFFYEGETNVHSIVTMHAI